MQTSETYKIQIDQQSYQTDDPVVTGRQILELAAKRPADEFLVFLKLRNGQLEEIRLDETLDLRQAGPEKLMTFRSDRSFRFSVDGRRFEWGASVITGATLKKLGDVNQTAYDLYLESVGTNDRLIENTDEVDLTAPGVERFFSVKRNTTEG